MLWRTGKKKNKWVIFNYFLILISNYYNSTVISKQTLYDSNTSVFVVVQSLSCVCILAALWTAAHQASLSFTISRSLLKLMSSESVMPSNHLILCRSLLLFPSIFLSIRVFSNVLALGIRWPKCWSFGNNPFNEYSGLISFRTDWFALLAVQGSLGSSPGPQFESINSLALRPLYGPPLVSGPDYRKNHSFDTMDLCWQSDVSAFQYH